MCNHASQGLIQRGMFSCESSRWSVCARAAAREDREFMQHLFVFSLFPRDSSILALSKKHAATYSSTQITQ